MMIAYEGFWENGFGTREALTYINYNPIPHLPGAGQGRAAAIERLIS
jgi:hypothetical protein